MRIGSQSVSRWRLWVKLDGNTSTLSVAKARSINPGRQTRNSRVSYVPAPMAIALARSSTIASDLVWYEIVYIEAVIVPSAGVFGRQRKVVFCCDFL